MADNVFSDLIPAEGEKDNAFSDLIPKTTLADRAKDVALAGAKGIVGVGETAVGLADAYTGGAAGNAMEDLGYDPQRTRQIINENMSPAGQREQQEVQGTDGFLPTIAAVAKRPWFLANTVVESAPSMAAGLAVGRGVQKFAPNMSAGVAGAIGEGAVSGAQTAEQIRQDTGTLDEKGTLAAVGSGTLVGMTGAIGNAAARAAKVAAPDTIGLLNRGLDKVEGNIAGRMIKGGAIEAAEEVVQSGIEQGAQNYAEDKPLMEGVGQQAAIGGMAGGVMGAGGAMQGHRHADVRQEQNDPSVVAPPGPLQAAVAVARANGSAAPDQAAGGPAGASQAPSGMGGTRGLIADAAARNGVDPNTALTIAAIETGGRFNPDAANPRSSARGMFQFMDATRRSYPEVTPEMWQDPQVQAEYGAKFIAATNARMQQTLGRAPTAAEAYMGHLLGSYGATQLLTADPNTLAKDVIAQYDPKRAAEIVRLNGMKDMTAGQAIQKWASLANAAQQRLGLEGQAFPFSDKAAAEMAVRAGAREGRQLEVAEHPTVPGRFAALPPLGGDPNVELPTNGVPTVADLPRHDTNPNEPQTTETIQGQAQGQAAAGPVVAARENGTAAAQAGAGAGTVAPPAAAAVTSPNGQPALVSASTGGFPGGAAPDAVSLQGGVVSQGLRAPGAQDQGISGATGAGAADAASAREALISRNPVDGRAISQAQIDEGNYPKLHERWNGLGLTIENKTGDTRIVTTPDGEKIAVPMKANYGYVKRTVAADQTAKGKPDRIDFYKPDDADPKAPVWVFDQHHLDDDGVPTGFDEHKLVFGVNERERAEAIYDQHFLDESGPLRRQSVTEMSMPEFKAWIKGGSTDTMSAAESVPQVRDARAVEDGVLPHSIDFESQPSEQGLFKGFPQAAKFARDSGLDAQPIDTGAGYALAPNIKPQVLSNDDAQRVADLNSAIESRGFDPVQPLRAAPSPAAALAAHVAEKAFGVKVIHTEPNEQFSGVFHGDRVFLGANEQYPTLAVAGHEVAHAFEGTPLHKQLTSIFQQYGTEPDRQVARRQAFEQESEGQFVPRTYARNEVVADMNGSMWIDSKFWGEMLSRDESLFRKVAYKFMELATKAVQVVKGSKFDSSTILRDVDAARGAIAQAWSDHLNGKLSGRKTGTTGQPLFEKTDRTIQVEGKRRHIEDSNGRAIAAGFKEQKNFWKFFGDSKVADAEGRPIPVYHGTSDEFNEFAPSTYAGKQGGIFFTADRPTAEAFAQSSSEAAGGEPRVVEAYLSARNPKVIDASEIMRDGAHSFDREFKAVARARKEGHDSLLIRNVPEHDGRVADQWVVLRPEQIKSATGNSGTFDATNPDIRFSKNEGEPADVKAKPGANIKRLAGLLGPQLYGDMSNMGTVTVKELFQNSFDALKGALAKGLINADEVTPRIDISLDRDARNILVSDNGTGMTPEIINKAFLSIAGTHKDTERGSGGFGIAKMLFLFGNDGLVLRTVKDGVESRLETSGAQLMESFENPDAAPTIYTRNVDEPNGTSVQVKVPADWRNPSTGEKEPISFPDTYDLSEILNNSPLFEPIDVYVNGSLRSIGNQFPKENFTTFSTVKFDWGTARIIVSKNELTNTPYNNLHVLSNGLWQFSEKIKENPLSYDSNKVPREFYINVEPRVKPEEPGYPFALNRQGFSPSAKEDFAKITNYLSLLYAGNKAMETAHGFGNIEYVDEKGNVSDKMDLKPVIDESAKKSMLVINEGDDIVIKDGRMLVNGREVPELDPKKMADAKVDVSKFKIQQSEVDPSRVMIHDNMDVFDGDESRGSISEFMRNWMGKRFDEYLYRVGDVFQQLRDEVAKTVSRYSSLSDVPVGVSFDEEYYGVNIRVPFKGMFLNPAITRLDAAVGEPLSARRVAYTMTGTMIHEITHHTVSNHSADFVGEMQRINAELESSETFDFADVRESLAKALREYSDVYEGLNKLVRSGRVKNRGVKLQDAASYERVGRDGVPVRPAGRGGAGRNDGVGRATGQGDQAGTGSQGRAAVRQHAVDQGPLSDQTVFEVAPDPRNAELKSRWDALGAQAKWTISRKVARDVVKGATEALHVKGNLRTQFGGYGPDSNPSMALVFPPGTAPGRIDAVTRIMGSALSQQSMMRTSPKPFDGSFEMNAIMVHYPQGSTHEELHALYQRIRELKDDKGEPFATGHTTAAGTMAILDDGSRISGEEFARRLAEHLGPQYDVSWSTLHAAFPEAGENDYGLSGQTTNLEGGSQASLRQTADRLRAEAQASLEKYLKGPGPAAAQAQEVGPRFSKNERELVNPHREAHEHVFYSALAREMDKVQAKALPVIGWKQQLTSLLNKGAIKRDEVYWSGIEDWLDKFTPGQFDNDSYKKALRSAYTQIEKAIFKHIDRLDTEPNKTEAAENELESVRRWDDQFNKYLNPNYPMGDNENAKPDPMPLVVWARSQFPGAFANVGKAPDEKTPDMFGGAKPEVPKVPKADVMRYLQKGGLELHEVSLESERDMSDKESWVEDRMNELESELEDEWERVREGLYDQFDPPVYYKQIEDPDDIREYASQADVEIPEGTEDDDLPELWGVYENDGYHRRRGNQVPMEVFESEADAEEREMELRDEAYSEWEDQQRDEWYDNHDARDQAEQEWEDMETDSDAEYEQYSLPGGGNYREILITLPGAYTEGTFNEDHWKGNRGDNASVVAHFRVKERTELLHDDKPETTVMNKVLFVEEIQSDWAQHGREEGFRGARKEIVKVDGPKESTWTPEGYKEGIKEWVFRTTDGADTYSGYGMTEAEAREDVYKHMTSLINMKGVPQGPFVDKTDKWVELALKRVIRMAAEEGYDKVAWATGEQNADRYGLQSEVDEIKWHQANAITGASMVTIRTRNHSHIELSLDKAGIVESASHHEDRLKGRNISEVVGREIASKIEGATSGSVEGDGLKVGGEGMVAFYNSIIPNLLKKMLPKLGGEKQLETITLRYPNGNRATDSGKAVPHQHQAFTINEKMKISAMGGLPLFLKNPVLKAVTVQDVKDRTGAKWTDTRKVMLPLLGGRQIAEVYGKLLPQLPRYQKLVQLMQAGVNDMAAQADDVARKWAGLKDERQLAELMHDATLAQVDPAKPYVLGDSQSHYRELNERWAKLTPEAQAIYKQARDMYEEHYSQVRDSIRQRIERSDLSAPKKSEMLTRMDGEFFKRVRGVYFPLARFGQYMVVVRDQSSKVAAVSRAETKSEADQLRRTLKGEYGQGYTVSAVMKTADFNARRDAVGSQFLQSLFKVLDETGIGEDLQDDINQLVLTSMPEVSWAKHGIHRKGTPGFSQDARRAFAQNMFHGVRYLQRVRFGDRLEREIGEMEKYVRGRAELTESVIEQQVIDEVRKRHDNMMNPKTAPWSQALNSFGFFFHLGLSPATALVNLSQTPLVAYPVLAGRWGFSKAAAALMKASADTASAKNDLASSLKGEELRAVKQAIEEGIIDVTMAHDLAGIAQGEDSGFMWKTRPVMRAASFMFHHAERFNRNATLLAAYRLARQAGSSYAQAFEQASDATIQSHFDYAASNRPRVMQGNVARVIMQFKQYSQNMLFTIGDSVRLGFLSESATPQEKAQARRTFAGLMVMNGMAAGAVGLPVVGWILQAASMMGGSADEPWDAQVALQNYLADLFGPQVAEVLLHGVSRLGPADVSGRVSLDISKMLFPDVSEALEGQEWYAQFATGMLGPVIGGIGTGAAKAMQQLGDGEWERALESITPSVIRNPLKAARFANEGARTKGGIPIKDEVSTPGLISQALGFRPSEVANAQEGRGAIIDLDRRLHKRRVELMDDFAKEAMKGDDTSAALAAIQKWNETNPTRVIAPMHLQQSIARRSMLVAQAQQGVYLKPRDRDLLQEGRFAVREEP